MINGTTSCYFYNYLCNADMSIFILSGRGFYCYATNYVVNFYYCGLFNKCGVNIIMNKTRGTHHKFWILPDGKLFKCKAGQWHYEAILENIKAFRKYGLDPKDIEDDLTENPVRKYAMSKGFTRVNLSINGGQLVIEAPQSHWNRKVKDGIFDFVDSHWKEIMMMAVLVLNKQFRPVKKAEVNWIRVSYRDKMESIPLVTEAQSEIFERRHKHNLSPLS